jgi:hypothetical protein
MFKTLIVFCAALTALAAFVLPAGASAENTPNLVEGASPGVALAAGAKIVGTNAGDAIFWNTATTVKQVTCTKATLKGEITKNKEKAVEGNITTLNLSGTGAVHPDNGLPECTDSFGSGFEFKVTRLPLLLNALPVYTTDEIRITGTGGNIRFDIIDTTVGACEYEATSTLKGDFTTGGTQTTLTTRDTEAGSGSKLIAGGFFCPTSWVLAFKFTLETENGTGVWTAS